MASNRPLIHFIYGLSVFLMGWTIWFQPRSASHLRMARSLPFLAAFGILRGVSEWGQTYYELQGAVTVTGAIHLPPQGLSFMIAVSFLFLYLFGCDLIRDINRYFRLLPMVGLGLLVLWAVESGFFSSFGLLTPLDSLSIAESEVWARYLLIVPGTMLASLALHLQTRQLRDAGFEAIVPDVRGASIAMAVYGVLGGILVPHADFFPANFLHIDLLPQMGLVVVLLRSACSMLIAFFMIRILRVFDTEIRHRLEHAEAAQASAEERERLGLELHDGILQSIYATGLGLQAVRKRILTDPEGAAQRVELTLERLNGVIDEIRAYIRSLTLSPVTVSDLHLSIRRAVDEFQALYGVAVTLTAELAPGAATETFSAQQIMPILTETLSNIGRHAEATRVEIGLKAADGQISLTISDNGKGFDLEAALAKRGHYGMRNLQRRAETAGGHLRIASGLGKGTRVEAVLPLQRGEMTP